MTQNGFFFADNRLYLHVNKSIHVQTRVFFSHFSKLIFWIFQWAETMASPHQDNNHTSHIAVNGNISFISMGTALGQDGQGLQTDQRLQLVQNLHMDLCLMNKLIQLGAVHKTIQKQKNLDYSCSISVTDNSALGHCKTFTWSSYASFYAASLKFRPYVKMLPEYLRLTLYIDPETGRKMRCISTGCPWIQCNSMGKINMLFSPVELFFSKPLIISNAYSALSSCTKMNSAVPLHCISWELHSSPIQIMIF